VQTFGKTSHHLGLSAPYRPDLAPCDFWLFSKLKFPLKGKIFQTANEIKENVTRQLIAIPKTFQIVLKSGRNAGISVRFQGEYFEGDENTIVLGLLRFYINWLDTFRTEHVHGNK